MPPARPEPLLAVRLRSLAAGEQRTIESLLDELERERSERERRDAARPHVLINMIASVDGRGAIDGRTAPLGSRADRALFHGLRTLADAVLVGAGTVRDERYGTLVRDPALRARREAHGRAAQPLACVVTRSLVLPEELPLLSDPESRVLVITSSSAELPPCPAQVSYLRMPGEGAFDLAPALGRLRAEWGARVVLCEGGPTLNSALLQAGAADELFLSIAPMLAGGSEPLTILHGPELEPPRGLILLAMHEQQSMLFARYAIAPRA